jgi:carbonic anhydrase
MDFDTYAFSKQLGFVETEMREAFKQAVPLRTVAVYCYDPRAVNIPHAERPKTLLFSSEAT